MKKFLFISGCILASLVSHAQVADSIKWQKLSSNMYCVSSETGKTLITHDGNIISGEVRLTSGAVLTTEGNITWNDKSQTRLHDGYCVDENGTLYAPVKMREQKKKATAIAR